MKFEKINCEFRATKLGGKAIIGRGCKPNLGAIKFEPVHCFIAGLGRLDFLHIHLLLTLKFLKCAQFTSNTVFKSLVGIHMQSSAFTLLLKSANLIHETARSRS